MASLENTEKNTFISTWKIENFAFYVHEKMSSPIIFAHSIDSEFRLELIFRKQQSGESVISFYLQFIHVYCQSIELDFELSLLALDGSPLISRKKLKKQFIDGKRRGFRDFVPLDDVVANRRTEFLPQGTLTLLCKIWKSEDIMSESVLCFARTRLGMEQSSFVWSIERFSSLTDNGTAPYSVRTASSEDLLLSMNLQLDTILSDGKQFELELTPENVLRINKDNDKKDTYGEAGMYDFKLSFINVAGYEKLDKEISRLECCEVHRLHVLITQEVLREGNGYIVDDVLALRCEFTFYTGIVSEEIERTEYGSGAMTNLRGSHSVFLYRDDMSTRISSLNDLQKFLYDTQLFCDVKLLSGTECFAAHKSILSAKSQVFQSMFEEKTIKDIVGDGDTKENVFEVLDVNAEVLRQIILYIYTDAVNDQQLENIYQLFVAAVQYKISSLKKKCSLILAEKINIHNACEMLRFADKHEDENLKLSVRDFILKYREVTGSAAWKILEKRNATLAEEIYRLM